MLRNNQEILIKSNRVRLTLDESTILQIVARICLTNGVQNTTNEQLLNSHLTSEIVCRMLPAGTNP